jgi:protein subunit release factor B
MDPLALSPETIARIRESLARAGVSGRDLEETFVRGSGPGGQKINKTSSCVCLRHGPSGLVVKCQRTRSREANRWLARRDLAERILAAQQGEQTRRQAEAERTRRQKRRRSRRQRARMLEDKRARGQVKSLRRSVGLDD